MVLSFLCFVGSMHAQRADRELFMKFESRFALLDSLIFKQLPLQQSSLPGIAEDTEREVHAVVDSLIYAKVENQMSAMKAETGLLISGQTYYRLDEGFGIDDDDALSRY